MKRYCLAIITACFLSLSLVAQGQLVDGDYVDAQLVAEHTAAVPGETLWVALRLIHEENWHTYWKNPGDAGLPTTIDWNLPQGVSADEIVWPVPQRLELPGDLVDFGFEDEVYLLTSLSIPADFTASSLEITADVVWLQCADTCEPSGADLSLSVPVAATSTLDNRWVQGFSDTKNQQPKENISLDSMFTLLDGNINLQVQTTEPLFENVKNVSFIPGEHRVFDYLSTPQVTFQLSSLQLSQGHHKDVADFLPEIITGLLIVEEGSGGLSVYHIAALPNGIDLSYLEGLLPARTAPLPLITVFFFALLGGMILNLMPCVFPVLSLKIIALAEARDSSRREQVTHALVYTGGVVLAFLALASILLTLQASGAGAGWGFQMQSPWFVALLILLFTVMALSLSGLLTFGTSVMGIGSGLTQQSGYRGSFFTGILASVVAAPCTAPFMGAALGVAITQPPAIALTIFAALGLGMAIPFLLVSAVPAIGRLLPRPGNWMLVFKHVMAIPLYATVLWLLWVLHIQVGQQGVVLVAVTGLLLTLALWVRQQATSVKEESSTWRYGSVSLLVSTILFSFVILRSPWLETQAFANTGGENYEVFSEARLSELRGEGRPVFVNLTASWCVTCLVNEKIALSSDSIVAAMQENDVTYLKGDWTNNDPNITAVLNRYDRSGVPLYLMFPAGPSASAEVLPQLLTESIILDALKRI